MITFKASQTFPWLACAICLFGAGCQSTSNTPTIATNESNGVPQNEQKPLAQTAPNEPAAESNAIPNKAQVQPSARENRKKQFNDLQTSMNAIAGIKSSNKGPKFDFQFVMPSDNWEKVEHAGGDRKSSVWLFQLKKQSQKILISCGGKNEAPSLTSTAMALYESSVKKHPELTREWKVGNFVLRRSFIGFIDDRHGEVTITAFSPICTLEFSISNEILDRDELFKLADSAVEEFMKANPTGGFPAH